MGAGLGGRPGLLSMAGVQAGGPLLSRVALRGLTYPLGLRRVNLLQVGRMLPSTPVHSANQKSFCNL